MYCTNCGRQIIDYSIFCEYCGAKQEEHNISDMLDNNQQQKINEDIAVFSDKKSMSQSIHNIDDYSNLDSMESKSIGKDCIINNNSDKSDNLKSNFFNKNIKKDLPVKKIIVLSSVIIALIIISLIAVSAIQNINAKKDIDYVVEQFNKDEIDYSKAINSLNNINCHERDSLMQYRSSAISHIDKLNKSKEAYASAQECMEAGKYDEAIPLFASVAQDDLNYQDAQNLLTESQQKYLDNVDELAERYISNYDYDLAIELYNQAKKILPDNEEEFSNKIAEIEEAQEAYVAEQIAELENSAKTSLDNHDYLSAIEEYQKLYDLTENDAYEVSIESVEYDWSNAVINDAEEQLAIENYDAAIEILKEPKKHIVNNSAIIEEEKRIDSFRPLDLTTLSPMAYGSEINEDSWWDTYQFEEWNSNVCDNTGVYGGNGVVFAAYTYITLPDRYYSYWKKYSIKDDYDTFSCKFAIPGTTESYLNTELSMVLIVYCDDQLIYTSDAITGGSLPLYIDGVNVSGASTITLEIKVSNNTGAQVANDRFAVGWVDPKLSKNYVPLNSKNNFNKPEDNNIVEDNLQSLNSAIDQSNTGKVPFYGIWCYSSKNEEEAMDFSKSIAENGIDSVVIVSTDWSNLNSEKYYVVTAGIYESEDTANDNLNSIKSLGYGEAYVKYSGEYIGK